MGVTFFGDWNTVDTNILRETMDTGRARLCVRDRGYFFENMIIRKIAEILDKFFYIRNQASYTRTCLYTC